MNFAKYIIFGMIFFVCSISANTVVDKLNDLSLNTNPPTVYQQQTLPDGFESLYYDGASYQDKSTRIFAYYKKPEGSGPFPAMVLVHGGGGSAYKAWIQQWNDAGFAAISIAVEGQTGTQINKSPPNKWLKHEWSGPRRPGIYNDADEPLTEQWMYHAATATINAHNLLRSFDDINQEQIGLSGISWGGVITSTVIGLDQRFAFAIPIYGCGFLDTMDNQYGKALKNNVSYREVWEPALRIAKFKKPTFWLTGLKENNFSLDAQANTYKLLTGQHLQSIQPTLRHSHPAGWAPKEPYFFAQAVINKQSLVTFYQHKRSKDTVSISIKNTTAKAANNISSATLFYTNDIGHTLKREWQQLPVTVIAKDDEALLTSTLPVTATAWLFNTELDGLTYSSEFFEQDRVEK
jgi:dienelactone hydrolase